MTAKGYLKQAWDMKCAIDGKHEQIMALQAMAERATSSYTALRVSGTTSRSKIEDAVAGMERLKDELGDLMMMYIEKYREVHKVIEAVENPVHRQLLTLRYLCFKSWKEIVDEMHYTYNHLVRYVHTQSLKSVNVPIESHKETVQ